jgi:hypothetical protein
MRNARYRYLCETAASPCRQGSGRTKQRGEDRPRGRCCHRHDDDNGAVTAGSGDQRDRRPHPESGNDTEDRADRHLVVQSVGDARGQPRAQAHQHASDSAYHRRHRDGDRPENRDGWKVEGCSGSKR